MSLGLVARADNTGLGIQSWEFHRHLSPAKTMIVDLAGRSASGKDLTIHPERFPHGEITQVTGVPTDDDIADWLEGLSTVVTLETPYNYRLYTLARQRGVQSVLQGNWELLDYLTPGDHQNHTPDVLALPSTWHLGEAGHRFGDRMQVIHLPVPIALDRFPGPPRAATATRWLHVAGYPALADRNGTRDLLAALRYVRSEITVTMTCQRPGWLGSLIRPGQTPDNVTLVIDSSPTEDYWSLYSGHHATVLPRRYGGLCLPVNESLGAGLPVVMPDIAPNHDWLPPDWLTPAEVSNTVMTKTLIDVYHSDPIGLAERIDLLSTDSDAYSWSRRHADDLANRYSWETLIDDYKEILQ